MPDADSHPIVFYDGVCGLCNRLVQFLLKHDKRDRLRFAPLQSTFASTVLTRHGADPADLDTVYVVVNDERHERLLDRSDAILFLFEQLGGIWRIVAWGRLLPKPVRNAAYRFVASNRYSVFGKSDSCMLPDPAQRSKFLEV